jgi:kinesin family protein 2/24
MQQQNDQQIKDVPRIRVIVRKRPLNKREIQKNDFDNIEMFKNNKLIVKELKSKLDLTKYIEEHHFTFDAVYDDAATNEMVRSIITKDLC